MFFFGGGGGVGWVVILNLHFLSEYLIPDVIQFTEQTTPSYQGLPEQITKMFN